MKTQVWYVARDEMDGNEPVTLEEKDGRVVICIAKSASGAEITPALGAAFARWSELTTSGIDVQIRVG